MASQHTGREGEGGGELKGNERDDGNDGDDVRDDNDGNNGSDGQEKMKKFLDCLADYVKGSNFVV